MATCARVPSKACFAIVISIILALDDKVLTSVFATTTEPTSSLHDDASRTTSLTLQLQHQTHTAALESPLTSPESDPNSSGRSRNADDSTAPSNESVISYDDITIEVDSFQRQMSLPGDDVLVFPPWLETETELMYQGKLCLSRCRGNEEVYHNGERELTSDEYYHLPSPVTCYRCTCEETCAITGTCCPLVGDVWHPAATHRSICTSAPYGQSLGFRASLVVVQCQPGYPAGETRDLCGAADALPAKRPDTVVPVTSALTRVTYANRHCAACNHDNTSLLAWRFGCRHHQELYHVLSDQEYDERAFNLTDLCGVQTAGSDGYCQNPGQVVDRCEAGFTGDEKVRRACEASAVSSAAAGLGATVSCNGRTYANVFCAMCNPTVSEIMSRIGSGIPVYPVQRSFLKGTISLLGRSRPPVVTVRWTTQCSQDQWLHPEGDCRSVTCAAGKTWTVNNTCVTAVDRIRGLGYRLKLRLLPVAIVPRQAASSSTTSSTSSSSSTAGHSQGITAASSTFSTSISSSTHSQGITAASSTFSTSISSSTHSQGITAASSRTAATGLGTRGAVTSTTLTASSPSSSAWSSSPMSSSSVSSSSFSSSSSTWSRDFWADSEQYYFLPRESSTACSYTELLRRITMRAMDMLTEDFAVNITTSTESSSAAAAANQTTDAFTPTTSATAGAAGFQRVVKERLDDLARQGNRTLSGEDVLVSGLNLTEDPAVREWARFLQARLDVELVAEEDLDRDEAEWSLLYKLTAKNWQVAADDWDFTVELKAEVVSDVQQEGDQNEAGRSDEQTETFPYSHPFFLQPPPSIGHLFLPLSQLLLCPRVNFSQAEFQVAVQEDDDVTVTFPHYLREDLTPVAFRGRDLGTLSGEWVLTEDRQQLLMCVSLYQAVFPANVTMMRDVEAEASLTRQIASVVCGSLSVLCLALTLLTYALFPPLRSLPGLNNMGLSGSLAAAQLSLLLPWHRAAGPTTCRLLGVLTHWLWLTALGWMAVCCTHMARVFTAKTRRGVTERSARRAFLQNVLLTTLVPGIMVALTVGVASGISGDGSMGYGGSLCFLDTSRYPLLILFFLLPLSLVLVTDLVCFLFAVVAIARVRRLRPGDQQQGSRLSEVLVYVKLVTVTGGAWVLGLGAEALDSEWLRVLAEICTASQGILLFLAYVCNARVWRLYQNTLGLRRRSERTTTSTLTESTRVVKASIPTTTTTKCTTSLTENMSLKQ